MRSSIALVAALTAATPVALSAQALTAYNAFFFNDFSHTNSETNGRLAVGGDATMFHWGVGTTLPTGYSDYSFVVGGNLNSAEGSVFNGKTYVGGTLSTGGTTGFPSSDPPVVGGPSPIDFAAEQTRLTNLSNAYAALGATGMIDLTAGELSFIGTAPVNIFSVTIATLQAGTAGYEFVTPLGATNIINVIGSSSGTSLNNTAFYFDCAAAHMSGTCSTGSNGSTPADAGATLWNFNNQTSIVFEGAVHGSILAPHAHITFGVGDVVGTVVANSATSSAEFWDSREFSGVTASAIAPEPGSMVLMSTGLIAVAGFARRVRRKRAG